MKFEYSREWLTKHLPAEIDAEIQAGPELDQNAADQAMLEQPAAERYRGALNLLAERCKQLESEIARHVKYIEVVENSEYISGHKAACEAERHGIHGKCTCGFVELCAASDAWDEGVLSLATKE